jgi:15-hydroxyprostaglandin dehydrogenase (NAD)
VLSAESLAPDNSGKHAPSQKMHKVALITGGSSGIGLALATHLLKKDWSVVLADLAPPPQDGDLPAERTLYIRTDVSSFDEQVELFSKAFKWHGRLDFAALNAGIEDQDDIFATIDTTRTPTKPNMSTFDVDLAAVYYGIKLFAHYAAQNPVPGGKVVATASLAGLYPSPGLPQYAAAKHGVVGLVRSLAPAAAPHNITINTVCPALVVTNLDPSLAQRFPERLRTDMSVVMKAFDEVIIGDRTGQAIELCAEGLYYNKVADAEAPSVMEMRKLPAMRDWQESLIQKNVQRALKNSRM